MPAPKGTLKERLAHYHQIKISVIGRMSGQTISIPVWLVLEGEKLYLLPVQGSATVVAYSGHFRRRRSERKVVVSRLRGLFGERPVTLTGVWGAFFLGLSSL